MTTSEWVISTTIATLAAVLGVAGYFIQKWIEAVDSKLDDHASELKDISREIRLVPKTSSLSSEEIGTAVRLEMTRFKGQFQKLDKIDEDVVLLKKVTQEKILPQLQVTNENLGRVIVIETKMGEQESKMLKLFEIMKALSVQRLK